MSERRGISRHPGVDPCPCGARLVDELADGIMVRLSCTDCGEFLGSIRDGAEP